MRLLEWAKRELTGGSPLHMDGIEIASRIIGAIEAGKPESAMVDDINALRSVLEKLREERRSVNARKQIGILLERSPQTAQFKLWLASNDLTEEQRAYALEYSQKGVYYG